MKSNKDITKIAIVTAFVNPAIKRDEKTNKKFIDNIDLLNRQNFEFRINNSLYEGFLNFSLG